MTTIQNNITQQANAVGVPVDIALAVAQTESGFNQSARSTTSTGKHAIGVFQLMPDTAAGLGVDPYDVDQNIRGGLTYLKQMYAQFGNWGDALAAYNAGPGRVSRGGTLPAETTDYVGKVLARADQWETVTGVASPAQVDAPEATNDGSSIWAPFIHSFTSGADDSSGSSSTNETTSGDTSTGIVLASVGLMLVLMLLD